MESQTSQTNQSTNGIGRQSATAAGVASAFSRKTDAAGKYIIDDIVEVSVLMMFFVQKLGKTSVDTALAKAAEIGAVIDPHLGLQGMEALKARGLLSYARGRRSGGESQRMWQTRKALWAAPPEMAQISDLLPALVATPEAKELIANLNQTEQEGDGDEKATRDLKYDHYVDVRIDFETLDQLIGSQPASNALEALVKTSPSGSDVEDDEALRFWRTPDGDIQLPPDVVRGWLRTGLRNHRPRGFSDIVASYIGTSGGVIKAPKDTLTQATFPVIDSRTRAGKGLNTYEALGAGATFSILFRFPTRGFMEPLEFVRFVASYAPLPIRGISPARGNRFGKLAVTGYEILGDSNESALKVARDMVPESARKFYDELLASISQKAT